MRITTMSNREFNEDTGAAKKATRKGQVFITDKGRPAHVLMSIEDYRRLWGGQVSLRDALAQPEEPDFGFDPPHLCGDIFKPADIS
jgi:hypothetical protein